MDNPTGWDEVVEEISQIVLVRENYQKTLGRLAAEVVSNYGPSALTDLSESIKETHGVSVSVSTLKNYRWVYEKTSELNLPDDLSYLARQHIASSGNPEWWASKVVDEGYSSAELIRQIRASKGLTAKKKQFVCKECGASNEV